MLMTDADIAALAAQAAREVHQEAAGRELSRRFKEGADFVTDVDVAAEAAALSVIREHRPGDAVVAEESGRSGPEGAERVWFVDPLCGTLNYASGSGDYGANVALVVGDAVRAAAVAEGARVCVADGETAWIREGTRQRPARPSPDSRLVEILMETLDPDESGFSSSLFWRSSAFSDLSPRFVGTGVALAWVATGRRAGFVLPGRREPSVHFAAGIGICRAAGCVLTDLRGGPLHLAHDGLVCAADRATHAALMAGIREQI